MASPLLAPVGGPRPILTSPNALTILRGFEAKPAKSAILVSADMVGVEGAPIALADMYASRFVAGVAHLWKEKEVAELRQLAGMLGLTEIPLKSTDGAWVIAMETADELIASEGGGEEAEMERVWLRGPGARLLGFGRGEAGTELSVGYRSRQAKVLMTVLIDARNQQVALASYSMEFYYNGFEALRSLLAKYSLGDRAPFLKESEGLLLTVECGWAVAQFIYESGQYSKDELSHLSINGTPLSSTSLEKPFVGEDGERVLPIKKGDDVKINFSNHRRRGPSPVQIKAEPIRPARASLKLLLRPTGTDMPLNEHALLLYRAGEMLAQSSDIRDRAMTSAEITARINALARSHAEAEAAKVYAATMEHFGRLMSGNEPEPEGKYPQNA